MLLRIMEEALGTWIALAISALIFAARERQRLALVGYCHRTGERNSVWCGLYPHTRALAADRTPLGLELLRGICLRHGTPVSGAQQPGLLVASASGPELWTGDAYGPETGLVALMLSGGIALIMLVICVRKGRVLTPAWLHWRGSGRELANSSI